MTSKRGVVMTVDSDVDNIESSFYFSAPLPKEFKMDNEVFGTSGDSWNIQEAYVWLYFSDGYLSFYDMGYDQAWSGAGPWLLTEIKSLTRGKYLKVEAR